MNINKRNRSINKARKSFIKWAKWRNVGACVFSMYTGEIELWGYYRSVSVTINGVYYGARFIYQDGRQYVHLTIESDTKRDLTIKQFKDLLK